MKKRFLVLSVLAGTLGAGTLGATGRVWVVNDGGGGDFLDIQPAVDAASDADVVLVQSGYYTAFTIDGKGLVVQGEAGGEYGFHSLFEIQVLNLQPHQDVVLRGLRALDGSAPRITAANNQGKLWIEDMRFEAREIDIPGAGHFHGTSTVVAVNSEFVGWTSLEIDGHGILAQDSNLYLYGCEVSADNQYGALSYLGYTWKDGAAGLQAEGGSVFLSGSVVEGGTPAQFCFAYYPGHGGDAVKLIDSVGYTLGSTLVGGPAMYDFYCLAPSNPGLPVATVGNAVHIALPGIAHEHSVPSPLREGDQALASFQGIGGELVYQHVDEDHEPAFLPPFLTPIFSTAPDVVSFVGALPLSGSLQTVVTAPSLASAQESAILYSQGIFVGSSSGGQNYGGDPTSVTILDESIGALFDDCNANGTEDAEDIASGLAPDCNENGVPDSCDLVLALSADCNANGLPDECEKVELVRKMLPGSLGAYGYLGNSVALRNDTVLAYYRENGDNGPLQAEHVYGFVRAADGSWPLHESFKLTGSDSQIGINNDAFGIAIAVHGDLLVVGAPFHDHAALNAGAAYVFERGGDGTWIEVVELLPGAGASTSGHFGYDLITDGTTIVVGAPGELSDDGGTTAGALYVFERDASGQWSEVARLTASDGGRGLGVPVRMHPGIIATRRSGPVSKVYFFERDSSGQWPTMETGQFAPADPFYGMSLHGKRLLLSDVSDSTVQLGSGIVREYENVDGLWQLVGTAKARAPSELDHLSVARWEASTLVASAEDDEFAVDSGAVYLFKRRDDSWSQVAKVKSPDPDMEDMFRVVAFDGLTLAVGALQDGEAAPRAGAIYVYRIIDCNQNDVPDTCDIAMGTSTDYNRNEIPDECEFAGHFRFVSDPVAPAR